MGRQARRGDGGRAPKESEEESVEHDGAETAPKTPTVHVLTRWSCRSETPLRDENLQVLLYQKTAQKVTRVARRLLLDGRLVWKADRLDW